MSLVFESSLNPADDGFADTQVGPIEVSIVMPCLNEAETLETCIRKAQVALREGRNPRRDHSRRQRQR